MTARAEHALVLLGHPDRHHPALPDGLGLLHQGMYRIDLAFVLGEVHHRDVIGGSEVAYGGPEPVAALFHDGRGGDRIAAVPAQECCRLSGNLQRGHVQVQVDPVETRPPA